MISYNAHHAARATESKPHFLFKRSVASLAILTFLSSCVTDPVHEAALKQAKEGPVEEGVSKLKESSSKQPQNASYRVDYLRERDRAVNLTLIEAARALGKGDLGEAESIYQNVLSIDPENTQAKLGLAEIARANRHAAAITHARDAMDKADYETAHIALQPVLIENPKDAEAQELNKQIDALRYTGAPLGQIPELGSVYKKPVSLQFKDANLKMILEAISKTSGLNILLDKDIKSDLKATIFVKKASVEDTLNLLLMQNQLEKRVLNDNTVYIYPATPAKLKEHQDLVIRTFQLTNADVKQMQNMLKTVLKSKDLFINEKTNSLVMRDTPEAVALAAKLLAAQDVNEPEVMLEVEVLEVSHTLLMQLGARYPDQVTFSAGAAATAATNTALATAGGLTLRDVTNLNDSKINVATSAGSINLILDLKKQNGDTNILASPRIRVKQHEKAKIHIGDRVPIITNSVTPVSTGTPVVTGSVQYLDVGLKLEVEPDIHMDGEVGIKTSLEVSSIADKVTNTSSGTVAYQIGTRNANTVLRLKDGETQVLAGLISDQELKNSVKVPGLGDIPLIGRLFSTHGTDKKKTEIILAITPHIIRNIKQPDADISTYWSGTDAVVHSRPLTVEKMDALKVESSGVSFIQPPVSGTPSLLPAGGPAAPVDESKPAVAKPASAPTVIKPASSVTPSPTATDVKPVTPAAVPASSAPVTTSSSTTAGSASAATGIPKVVPRTSTVSPGSAGMGDAVVDPVAR